jgi:hypothetical protein
MELIQYGNGPKVNSNVDAVVDGFFDHDHDHDHVHVTLGRGVAGVPEGA